MTRVSALTPSTVDAAAEVLALAFADDPVVAGLVPLGRRRPRTLRRWFTALVRTTRAVDVARDADGRVVGVALWDEHPRPPSVPWWLRELPRLLRALGPRQLVRTVRAVADLESHRPTTPHWYLADIAVRPAAQGRGVASALLAHRLRELDAAGATAYLESTSPAAARLYVRHGFRAVGAVGHDGAVAMLRAGTDTLSA
ncbi:GNAT family N-acetyltransferase [Kineococcus sp. SYSU DK003]|uniref:GNAT family N-acetyltransferase n=1 Tax=Kineococcus sp. SYSU DK003 TaxID=3383124 RepID=UPI003D7DB749